MLQTDKASNPRIVIIGGGSAGIGLISSLKKRLKSAKYILIEPREDHFYQPAWTLVGRGAYDVAKTRRKMSDVIPDNVEWVKEAACRIIADKNMVQTTRGHEISYDYLVVASGLVLRWDKIEGLEETLGKNGVTSNYRFDLAPYTWKLVKEVAGGNAIFTQPAMPIKCAGAPQKALYLSCDHWKKNGVLTNINVNFCLAGKVVFGVEKFVPKLKEYLNYYGARVNYCFNLIRVDGDKKLAYFSVTDNDGLQNEVCLKFDMLHVVPPQSPPEFIADSQLGDASGWCAVNQFTLQHTLHSNIFSLGDCCSAPNSKTAAAARKQIVVVAQNINSLIRKGVLSAKYDGYGSCPLTVEKGKVVLAEFGYNNRLLPTFPLDPVKPSRLAWWLKADFLPFFYWRGMLKGIEWFAKSKS